MYDNIYIYIILHKWRLKTAFLTGKCEIKSNVLGEKGQQGNQKITVGTNLFG